MRCLVDKLKENIVIMGYRQEWCKNMKDRIEDKKDIKLQKEMKQYRKRYL